MLDAMKMNMHKRVSSSHPVLKETFKILAIIFGAVSVAAGLELFLVPNGFLDGGVTGISIMLSSAFPNVPLGIFLAVLNLPFIILAWKFSGWHNAFRTALGIAVLSVSTVVLHHFEALTHEFVLALGYGGVCVGIGVGLALRYGGALDGIESLAHILSNRTNLEVDKIILTFNFFVFLVAIFVYSPEQAMASFLLFYVVVAPMIKRIVNVGTDVKTVQIISTYHSEIGEMIKNELGRKVIYTDAHKDNMTDDLKIVTTFISRMEESNLVETVETIDPKAIVILNDAASVHGGMFSNKKH